MTDKGSIYTGCFVNLESKGIRASTNMKVSEMDMLRGYISTHHTHNHSNCFNDIRIAPCTKMQNALLAYLFFQLRSKIVLDFTVQKVSGFTFPTVSDFTSQKEPDLSVQKTSDFTFSICVGFVFKKCPMLPFKKRRILLFKSFRFYVSKSVGSKVKTETF